MNPGFFIRHLCWSPWMNGRRCSRWNKEVGRRWAW
nr:MAG TPA: hypothetical protein [Caudoviricetes sp.]